jgi:hypothetical protein
MENTPHHLGRDISRRYLGKNKTEKERILNENMKDKDRKNNIKFLQKSGKYR